MNLEIYATEIVTGVLAVTLVLLIAATLHFSRKREKIVAEAKDKQDEAKAIAYETAERLCVGMACALFAVALLNINHSTTVDGICIIIQKLEVLLRGH